MHLANQGRTPQVFCVDADKALARSAEFVDLCFRLGVKVEDTGGYASYLNGKVKCPNGTIFGGVRAMLKNHQLHPKDWCEAASHFPKVYNMTLHRSINDTPFNKWFG